MVKKEIIIGLITGFIANISGLVLAILFLNDNPSSAVDRRFVYKH